MRVEPYILLQPIDSEDEGLFFPSIHEAATYFKMSSESFSAIFGDVENTITIDGKQYKIRFVNHTFNKSAIRKTCTCMSTS